MLQKPVHSFCSHKRKRTINWLMTQKTACADSTSSIIQVFRACKDPSDILGRMVGYTEVAIELSVTSE